LGELQQDKVATEVEARRSWCGREDWRCDSKLGSRRDDKSGVEKKKEEEVQYGNDRNSNTLVPYHGHL
jgi:hypothetical protein